jgi:hypothetical protein
MLLFPLRLYKITHLLSVLAGTVTGWGTATTGLRIVFGAGYVLVVSTGLRTVAGAGVVLVATTGLGTDACPYPDADMAKAAARGLVTVTGRGRDKVGAS